MDSNPSPDHHIFLDESGESSFSDKSCYKHFALTTLTVSDDNLVAMRRVIKRQKGALYKLGWPRSLEIKASVLHGASHNYDLPAKLRQTIKGNRIIADTITSLCRACGPDIDYIVVRKAGLTSASFRAAPPAIAYNYFAGKVLERPVTASGNCLIIPDQKNKETHENKPFKEYIHTQLHGAAFEAGRQLTVDIRPLASDQVLGLQAVDFLSWAVFRAYEHKDDRFLALFKKHIRAGGAWYCPKK